MTVPADITDPRLIKAIAHPLRIRILGMLEDRVASPREIATELGTPLSNTSYHMRKLASLGLLELVGRTARRGAIEHHYTACVRPTITDQGWASLPRIVKRGAVASSLQQGVAQMIAASEEGGFDREDTHYSRTAAQLDEKGWRAVSRELAATLGRIDRIVQDAATRIADAPETEVDDATVMLVHFGGPQTPARPQRRAPQEVDILEK